MKNTIAITNQKGGVGKSTTAQALGEGLRRHGFRVLSVDMDPQGNLSFAMGADVVADLTISDVLIDKRKITEAIQHTEQGDVLPANVLLAGAETELRKRPAADIKLLRALELVADQYDWIIIDTPPSLGILTDNALMAADRLIVPMVADIYSLQGIAQLLDRVEQARDGYNEDLRIDGLLITKHNGRANIRRSIHENIEQLAAQIGCRVYGPIREAVALVEAQAMRQGLHEYAGKSKAVADYDAFVEAFLQEG